MMNFHIVKKTYLKTTYWLLAVMLPVSGFGQSPADSIIMSAMYDELSRNMSELRVENMDPPFFIAYSIADARISYASATLGALNTSGQRRYKDWNVRLMVGDYQLNDENFSATQPQEYTYENAVNMPVDTDYLGIRRSLWLTTNRVYNSAARTYKNKVALIEHKKLDTSLIDLPDFSRAPSVNFSEDQTPSDYTLEQLEALVRTLSKGFANQKSIFSSNVSVQVFESMIYFLNSEGTTVRYPLNITTLTVYAGSMTDDSDRIGENITYAVHNPDDLPSVPQIEKDIEKLSAYIGELRKAPRFEEEYAGPVLFLGDEATKTFGRVLFGGSDNLVAAREELHSSNQMNMYYSKSSNGLESRIGKLIIPKSMSVTALPAQKEYEGIPLYGHFEVDAEGVIPPDSLILIENGILKTLLNGRTPSRSVAESNGHNRFSYSLNGLSSAVGPGNILIETTEGEEMSVLRENLMSAAEEAGLSYAVVIRPIDVGSSDKPRAIYRIDLETGQEELLRSVRVSSPDLRSVKNLLGVSSETQVMNTLWSGYGGNGNSGIPVSFITPAGLLLDDVELNSYRKSLTSMLPIVENPVGLKQDSFDHAPDFKENYSVELESEDE